MIFVSGAVVIALVLTVLFVMQMQGDVTPGTPPPATNSPYLSMSDDGTRAAVPSSASPGPSRSYEGTGARPRAVMRAETEEEILELLRLEPLSGFDVPHGPAASADPGAASETMRPPAKFEPKHVIGPDDGREHVADTAAFPYRAVVFIKVNGGRCSGFLYGKDIVATAGHCVHGGGSAGKWYKDAVVWPGRDDRFVPYGPCKGRKLYSVAGWVERGDERYDLGAIKLDCEIGKLTGWFGLATESDVTGFASEVAGYPADKGLGQWTHKDSVRQTSDLQIFYQNDTEGGMSGGPVFLDLAGCGICSMSVHAYYLHGQTPHSDHNHGVKLTPEVYNTLIAWRDAN